MDSCYGSVDGRGNVGTEFREILGSMGKCSTWNISGTHMETWLVVCALLRLPGKLLHVEQSGERSYSATKTTDLAFGKWSHCSTWSNGLRNTRCGVSEVRCISRRRKPQVLRLRFGAKSAPNFAQDDGIIDVADFRRDTSVVNLKFVAKFRPSFGSINP